MEQDPPLYILYKTNTTIMPGGAYVLQAGASQKTEIGQCQVKMLVIIDKVRRMAALQLISMG